MNNRSISSYIIQKMKENKIYRGETIVRNNEMIELYYECGKINMVRNVFTDNVHITVINNSKKGFASTTKVNKTSIKKTLKEVIMISNNAISDDFFEIAEHNECREFVKGINEYNLDKMYEYLNAFITNAKIKYPSVKFDSASIEFNNTKTFYANTFGAELSEENGHYTFKSMFIGVDEDQSSSFNTYILNFEDLFIPFIQIDSLKRCLEDVENQIKPKSINGIIEGDVIFSPSCFETILYDLFYLYLSDSAICTNTSPWKNLLGEKVASDYFTLRLAPSEFITGSAITEDKHISKDTTIVENGILKDFMLTKEGAKRVGFKRSDNTSYNAVIMPGKKCLDELIKSTKKGILVNRLSGGDTGSNGDFSGVVKNSFLIEDGQLKFAIKETMISGNIGEIFSNIKDISIETIDNGTTKIPYIKTCGMLITGR